MISASFVSDASSRKWITACDALCHMKKCQLIDLRDLAACQQTGTRRFSAGCAVYGSSRKHNLQQGISLLVIQRPPGHAGPRKKRIQRFPRVWTVCHWRKESNGADKLFCSRAKTSVCEQDKQVYCSCELVWGLQWKNNSQPHLLKHKRWVSVECSGVSLWAFFRLEFCDEHILKSSNKERSVVLGFSLIVFIQISRKPCLDWNAFVMVERLLDYTPDGSAYSFTTSRRSLASDARLWRNNLMAQKY